jgi:hypothetical protein
MPMSRTCQAELLPSSPFSLIASSFSRSSAAASTAASASSVAGGNGRYQDRPTVDQHQVGAGDDLAQSLPLRRRQLPGKTGALVAWGGAAVSAPAGILRHARARPLTGHLAGLTTTGDLDRMLAGSASRA